MRKRYFAKTDGIIKSMHIIVGLGNPGQKYESTRHNTGFMAVNALAKEFGLAWAANKKFKAEIAESPELMLIKPQNFMNNSGFSIAAVLNYYLKHLIDKGDWRDLLIDTLTVIHDDLDIEFGKYKISVNSRSAGHKGVESIINQLKTKNFKRFRIGIRAPALEKIPADEFVLQKFNDEEKKIINQIILKIIRPVT